MPGPPISRTLNAVLYVVIAQDTLQHVDRCDVSLFTFLSSLQSVLRPVPCLR